MSVFRGLLRSRCLSFQNNVFFRLFSGLKDPTQHHHHLVGPLISKLGDVAGVPQESWQGFSLGIGLQTQTRRGLRRCLGTRALDLHLVEEKWPSSHTACPVFSQEECYLRNCQGKYRLYPSFTTAHGRPKKKGDLKGTAVLVLSNGGNLCRSHWEIKLRRAQRALGTKVGEPKATVELWFWKKVLAYTIAVYDS